MKAGRRAIFLDRDGVLNRAVVRDGMPYPPASPEEVSIPEDVPAALEAARSLGFLLIGVTNQPDVARGTVRRETAEAINARLLQTLPVLEMCVCWHDDKDACDCRKPKPGLLIHAAERHGIDLAQSFMIGDRWRDVEAGRRAGCTTIWIDLNYQEPWPVASADHVVWSLSQAVQQIGILAREKQHQ